MFKNKSFYEKKKKGKQVGNLGNGVGLGTGFNIKTNNRLLSVFMDKWVNVSSHNNSISGLIILIVLFYSKTAVLL